MHVAPPDPPLGIWKLDFRAGNDHRSLVWPPWKGEVSVKTSEEDDGAQVATICWSGMWFQHEPKSVDVKVTVRLPADSVASQWRIKVDNRSERYGPLGGALPLVRQVADAEGRTTWRFPGTTGGTSTRR